MAEHPNFYWWLFGEHVGTYIIVAYVFVPLVLLVKNYVLDRRLSPNDPSRMDAAICGLAAVLAPLSLVLMVIYGVGYILGGTEGP